MAGLGDKQIQWMRKRLWLPLPYINALGNDATSGVTLAAGLDDLTELWAELSDFGFGALKMTADNKVVSGALPCPYDLDPKFEVGFKVHWTGDVTGSTAEVTWLLLQDVTKRGVALAKASTALNTILVSDPNHDANGAASATDYLYQSTPRGIRNSIGLTRANIEEGALITFNLEQASATAETNIYLMGIEMDYVAQLCVGVGSEIISPLTSVGK